MRLKHGTGGLTMGQHKTNPVAIAAKEGKLPPKEKNRMSKRQAERLLMLEMERRLIPAPLLEHFRNYCYTCAHSFSVNAAEYCFDCEEGSHRERKGGGHEE